jgi:hypothetical protein
MFQGLPLLSQIIDAEAEDNSTLSGLQLTSASSECRGCGNLLAFPPWNCEENEEKKQEVREWEIEEIIGLFCADRIWQIFSIVLQLLPSSLPAGLCLSLSLSLSCSAHFNPLLPSLHVILDFF